MWHIFHEFVVLKEVYRLCKNPVFEQLIIIKQCVHCKKTDEYKTDTFRLVEKTQG